MQKLPENKMGWGIRVLLGCGLRSQELLALMPQHIEPDGSAIHIRQAVSMVRGTVSISTPKSYDSFRTVPVPENIRGSVLALRGTDDTYIFQSPVGNMPINPSTFRKYYREMLESIPGVRYLSPHACRHTYVSTLHALGVDAATIQSMVGHSTVLMTKHYLHVHPSIQQEAVDKFAKAFARDKRPALDDVIQAAEKERKLGESHTVAGVCEKEVR
jgi:integrase